MSESYFGKFPFFTYSNTVCINITERVAIVNTVPQDLFAYYPYVMKQTQRADTIAERYYSDPYFDWLVYMSNGIVDPYYQLPMDEITFTNYINAKYGSIPAAQQQILFWQVDWASAADDRVSVGDYQTNLIEPLKKYYQPVYGQGTQILYYQRRRVDWQASTNMVLYFSVANTVGTFQPEETVTLQIGNTVLSNSVVTFSNSSQVTVQHVFGNISSNSTSQFLLGSNSGATGNVEQITIFANNISQDELAFWGPVYAYDHEVGKNEQNKFIRLIDSKYSLTVSNTLRKQLQL